ncbi:unnamed protein product [Polarella glacialis]|uniref:Uncharacterized protein n=1 Tax=Polarella glacialis TaxID=89957 RepID=A0A813H7N9_POLGL|nr:unnamed protein product [Polarella glacialis]
MDPSGMLISFAVKEVLEPFWMDLIMFWVAFCLGAIVMGKDWRRVQPVHLVAAARAQQAVGSSSDLQAKCKPCQCMGCRSYCGSLACFAADAAPAVLAAVAAESVPFRKKAAYFGDEDSDDDSAVSRAASTEADGADDEVDRLSDSGESASSTAARIKSYSIRERSHGLGFEYVD